MRSDAIGKLEQWIDALEMMEGVKELQDCGSAFTEEILKQASIHDVLGLLVLTLALKYVFVFSTSCNVYRIRLDGSCFLCVERMTKVLSMCWLRCCGMSP